MTVGSSLVDVSVVMSTYNRARVLPTALQSLRDQDFDHNRYEVVVIDNNSTDETRKVVDLFGRQSHIFRYVFEPRQGVSYGRIAGLLAATAPIVAFTDDDLSVTPHLGRHDP